MSSGNQALKTSPFSVLTPAAHLLHECRTPEEFSSRFESSTTKSPRSVVDQVIDPAAPKAVFLTGSLPLGMATNGSDVDFVVLIDSKDVVPSRGDAARINTDQHLEFVNESDPLRAALFISVLNGITVEVTPVITSAIKRVYGRLRAKGPELSEGEIMTLGRLSTGWLLWESEGYLERNQLNLGDPALNVYCCTKHFAFALIYTLKARRALELSDLPQALHLGRLGVEMAYLAYFASEGFPYLGAKWLAQIGHARGAAERVSRHPLLKEAVPLLFPTYRSDPEEVACYLREVAQFQAAMKGLITRKTLYRIAFETCPQIS